MVQRDTFYMILLVMNSLFLEMLYFMKLFFLFLRKISVTSTCTPNFDIDGQDLEPLTLLPTVIMPNNSPTPDVTNMPNDITPTPTPIRQSPIYKITTAIFLLLLTPLFIKISHPCFLYPLFSLMKNAALLTNNFVYLFPLLLNLKLLLRPASIIAG